MAPSPPSPLPTQNPPSCSNNLPNGTVDRIRSRWKSQNMQGMAPKLLFMTGFLINSTAMSGLFFLLNFQFDQTKNSSQICVPFPVVYKYSISFSCTFFTFLALIVFVIICLMQCKRYKLDENAYKLITIFGSTAFIYSILLVLISSTAIIMQEEKGCKETPNIIELKLRHFIQSMAACVTNVIYMIVGISLIKNRVINPIPPQTPIYQISPPEFDSLFPPPPTYQQSQIHHQIQ